MITFETILIRKTSLAKMQVLEALQKCFLKSIEKISVRREIYEDIYYLLINKNVDNINSV